MADRQRSAYPLLALTMRILARKALNADFYDIPRTSPISCHGDGTSLIR